jgi:hypothetical protein
MAAPPPATSTTVDWSVRSVRLAGLVVPVARLHIALFLAPLSPGGAPFLEWALLDTGAPLSVIPFAVHRQGVAWRPLPGVATTWAGQACALGQVEIWLPDAATGVLRGPFGMLAKFATSDPPGHPPPVLLGLEFLVTHHAVVGLPPPPGRGEIR